jgi:signal transduction histidine kinase
MSHELRTPLNAIAGYTQLLLMELHGPITGEQREALERVERSQRHLLRLINEVLNLARVEAGRVDYDIRDFPVQQVVAELGPMIQPQFDAKGVRYEVRLPSTPVMVRADRDKVTQILLNLLANAVKFTPEGGRVVLDSASRAGVDAAFVRVTDSGIGIPRDKQAQIFEPFVQVHTGPTRVAEGAGLGLAISYDLAKAMGGDLRVRSEEGKGARFTLSLPKGES